MISDSEIKEMSQEDRELHYIAYASRMLTDCGTRLVITPDDCSPEGVKRARLYVDGMLAAAHAGGYMQCEILETMLSKCDVTERLEMMAQCACEAAGVDGISRVVSSIKELGLWT
jgi:hypothetical protein